MTCQNCQRELKESLFIRLVVDNVVVVVIVVIAVVVGRGGAVGDGIIKCM